MANLYSIPLKNAVQKTLAGTLTQAETGTITLDSSVVLELQATSSMKGILVVDRVDVNGNLTPTKTEYISFTGVSGSTVTGLTRGVAGTSAQGHSIGAIVEFVADITWAQAINDVFTTQHNDDGTHKTLSSISLASVTLNYPVINNPIISGGSLASLSLTNVSISGTITNPTISGGSFASTTIYTSTIDTFSLKNTNGIDGNLINGKIVPTVASNNLTLALKTMAGNDASATNPIYVRIGDVVRSITGALSITTNAGTNWFDSGSSELATKEVDYFAYLGYNATDGVVLGFAKIPYATIYSDFSATSTNEKYAAISTITNAAAGDNYVLIGRFAATLSAGAGYTWTVPTYTGINLIQRPIYQTRLLEWSPVYTGYSGSPSSNIAEYRILGNYFYFFLYVLGTSNSATFNFTLPYLADTIPSGTMPLLATVVDNNTWQTGSIGIADASKTVKVGKTVASISGNAFGGFTTSGTKGVTIQNTLVGI